MADDIIKCGLSVFSNIKCDKYHLYPKDTGVIPLKNCNIDITAHLKSVKVAAGGFRNFSRSPVADNEGQLILNRVGLFDTKLYKDIFVCPAHRFKLGIYFKQKKHVNFLTMKVKEKFTEAFPWKKVNGFCINTADYYQLERVSFYLNF